MALDFDNPILNQASDLLGANFVYRIGYSGNNNRLSRILQKSQKHPLIVDKIRILVKS